MSSSHASYDDVMKNADMLRDPSKGNYQVQGIPQYQSQLGQSTGAANAAANNGAGRYDAGAAAAGMGQQSAATNLIAQTAAGNGPSLAKANMLAGLSQQNNAIASQAMTNQGNTGGGLSQRNLLNAQASAGNNYINQAGTASVAEQLGAQANYASAANAQTQGAMANAQNASQAGLAQNQQKLSAAQLAASNASAGQNANWQQTQANMGYDAANMQSGVNRSNIGLQATNSDAARSNDIFNGVANGVMGVASLAAMSDEKCKKDIEQGEKTKQAVGDTLTSMSQSMFGGNKQPGQGGGSHGDGLLHPGSGIQAGGGYDGSVAASSPAFDPMGGAKGIAKAYSLGHPSATAGAAAPSVAGAAGSAGYGMPGAAMGGGSIAGAAGAPATAGYAAGGAAMGGGAAAAGGAGMLSALGPLAALSDERCKQGAQQASPQQLGRFMDAMEPSTYQYKDQNYSPGQHLGVMAQDVDDSKVGKDMVEDHGGLKAINVPKALGATLASLAYLNDRIDGMESKKKRTTSAA